MPADSDVTNDMENKEGNEDLEDEFDDEEERVLDKEEKEMDEGNDDDDDEYIERLERDVEIIEKAMEEEIDAGGVAGKVKPVREVLYKVHFCSSLVISPCLQIFDPSPSFFFASFFFLTFLFDFLPLSTFFRCLRLFLSFRCLRHHFYPLRSIAISSDAFFFFAVAF